MTHLNGQAKIILLSILIYFRDFIVSCDELSEINHDLNVQNVEIEKFLQRSVGINSALIIKHLRSSNDKEKYYEEFLRYYDLSPCPHDDNVSQKYVKRHVMEGLVLNSTISATHWNEYKSVFNKTYGNKIDREMRAKDAFVDNLKLVANHNQNYLQGIHSYSLHLNHFADMTGKQYLKKMARLITTKADTESIRRHQHLRVLTYIPNEWDWRQHGYKPRLEAQFHCGACYAFAVAHALQAQLCKKNSICPDLSVQQIVDCSNIVGNLGCGGGSLSATMRYISTYGLQREMEYPYLGKLGRCLYNDLLVKARPIRWGTLPEGDESALERTVATVGPIAVAINAEPTTFQFYRSGVYDDTLCSSDMVNHAMLLIGYTKDYWILMNWWGVIWGESGYMRLKRGHNRCGVANIATYVLA